MYHLFWPLGYSGTSGDVEHIALLSPDQGGIPPTYQPHIQYKNVAIIAQYTVGLKTLLNLPAAFLIHIHQKITQTFFITAW